MVVVSHICLVFVFSCVLIFAVDSEDESAKPALSGNMCELVWQGTVQARSFNAFKFQVHAQPGVVRSTWCIPRTDAEKLDL